MLGNQLERCESIVAELLLDSDFSPVKVSEAMKLNKVNESEYILIAINSQESKLYDVEVVNEKFTHEGIKADEYLIIRRK